MARNAVAPPFSHYKSFSTRRNLLYLLFYHTSWSVSIKLRYVIKRMDWHGKSQLRVVYAIYQ